MRHDRSDPTTVNASHLYVHVPFCARRCVYCDFSIAVRSTVPVAEFLDGIARELELRHRQSSLDLATVYLGGGTPSRLGADGVARLLDLIAGRASIQQGAEITLEANPEDVTPEAARGWASAGVNRVSLGVQSFQDPVLQWMHRTHDAAMALRAIQVLREAGLANLSIDLIFATPASVDREWESDLAKAAALDLPHVSVYGLTVEPHTPLGRWVARSSVSEAPEDRFEQEFLRADRVLTATGLEHYEVSNYGKPGAHSRHNWAYWQRQPYGGIGPSAHEFDGRERRWNVAPYAAWLALLRSGGDPREGTEILAPAQVEAEQIYLDLRTRTGVTLSGNEAEHVRPWIDAGWATSDPDGVLRLTPLGWLRLDALVSDLTLFRSRY
jgi:oxygen-independent coproporphyrinogen III oxidase